MNHWMCTECNYTFEAEMPPEACPSCNTKCEFVNVTCYIPECGGPQNIDTRLVAQRVQEAREKGT